MYTMFVFNSTVSLIAHVCHYLFKDSSYNFFPYIFPEHFERDPLLESTTQVSDVDSEPVYGNIGFNVPPVKVEDLWDYVKNNRCNDCEGFRREYKVTKSYETCS